MLRVHVNLRLRVSLQAMRLSYFKTEVESNELHLLALLWLSSFFVYLYFFKYFF